MGSLVRVLADGNIAWASAVEHIADALNPLGSVARIVSEMSACVVEHRRLDLEYERLEMQRRVIDRDLSRQWLFQHAKLVLVYEGHRRTTREREIAHDRIGHAYENVLAQSTDHRANTELRMLSQQTLVVLGDQMLGLLRQGSDELVRVADALKLGELTQHPGRWRALEL